MMSTCSREAALLYRYRSAVMKTGTGLFRWKNHDLIIIIDWSVKMPLYWLIAGARELQAPSNRRLIKSFLPLCQTVQQREKLGDYSGLVVAD